MPDKTAARPAPTTRKIRFAVIGYGNIGAAAVRLRRFFPDLELVGVFTRRPLEKVKGVPRGVKVHPVKEAPRFKNRIEVALLCGGSATDLPEQGPRFASLFNTVDSFDTHALIGAYFKEMDRNSRAARKTAVISTGWDPGLFSLERVFHESILPAGVSYTFWGPGVSQGHSDAARRVPGVADARAYTVPVASVFKQIKRGGMIRPSARRQHIRVCYVVPRRGADRREIEEAIKKMPNYFLGYETTVTFISREEMKAKHSRLPHGGTVLRSGKTIGGRRHLMEFVLQLDSNPEFTASVMLAYARAASRLNREGVFGAKTVLDIAPAYLSARPREELLEELV